MNIPIHTDRPKSRARGRWWKVALRAFVALVLVCLGLVFAVRAYYLHKAEARLKAAMAEADRLDPGWRGGELLAGQEDVPEDQNSALHVMAAAALLPANWPFMPASLTMEPAADRSAPRFMSRGYPEMRLVQQLSKLEAIHQLDEDLDKGLRAEL